MFMPLHAFDDMAHHVYQPVPCTSTVRWWHCGGGVCLMVCRGVAMRMLLRLLCLLALGAAPLVHAAYTVNTDGTVTDSTTSLMWDRCVLGRSGTSCTGTATTYTWADALAQVSARNTANHLGYNDWRLPNRTELESLVKLDVQNPAIDATAFPNTPTNWTWTSTTYVPDPAGAWIINFSNGDAYGNGATSAYLKTASNFVRLVRSGPSFSFFDAVGAASYTASTPPGSSTIGNVTTALTGGGASCALGVVGYQSASSVGVTPPAGVIFPSGVVNFTTTGCTAGGTITITLTYPSALPVGAQFYKYGPATAGAASTWYVHPATVVGNTITYSVTDGGQGDSNTTAGVITDPGGPGIPMAGGAGVASIPTLGEWARIALFSLMALAAAFSLKRRII
jgi:hypothetical protein